MTDRRRPQPPPREGGAGSDARDAPTAASAVPAAARADPPRQAYHFPAKVAATTRTSVDGGVPTAGTAGVGADADLAKSLTLGSLATEPVDLDLSFDFVSHLEGASKARQRRTTSLDVSAASYASVEASPAPSIPARPSNPTPSRGGTVSEAALRDDATPLRRFEAPLLRVPSGGTDASSSGTSSSPSSTNHHHYSHHQQQQQPSPRGMAEGRWTSRLRKKPPPPLALPTKPNVAVAAAAKAAKTRAAPARANVAPSVRARVEAAETTGPGSYFSPLTTAEDGGRDVFSPDSDDDLEDALVPTPLSATRRAADSGVSPSSSSSSNAHVRATSTRRGLRRRSSSGASSRRSALGPPSAQPPTEPLPSLPPLGALGLSLDGEAFAAARTAEELAHARSPTSDRQTPLKRSKLLEGKASTGMLSARSHGSLNQASADAQDAAYDSSGLSEEEDVRYVEEHEEEREKEDSVPLGSVLPRTSFASATAPRRRRSSRTGRQPSQASARSSWSAAELSMVTAEQAPSSSFTHGRPSLGNAAAATTRESMTSAAESFWSARTAPRPSDGAVASMPAAPRRHDAEAATRGDETSALDDDGRPSGLLFAPLSRSSDLADTDATTSSYPPTSQSSSRRVVVGQSGSASLLNVHDVSASGSAGAHASHQGFTTGVAGSPPTTSTSYRGTPATPFSPLFSEQGTAQTSATSPNPGHTPLTAVSKLAGSETNVASSVPPLPGSAQEQAGRGAARGRHAGLALEGVISEEVVPSGGEGMLDQTGADSSSSLPRIPTGLPRDDTAQWIRSQSEARALASLGESASQLSTSAATNSTTHTTTMTTTDSSAAAVEGELGGGVPQRRGTRTRQPIVVDTTREAVDEDNVFEASAHSAGLARRDDDARHGDGGGGGGGAGLDEREVPKRRRGSSSAAAVAAGAPWPQSPLLLTQNLPAALPEEVRPAESTTGKQAASALGLGIGFEPDGEAEHAAAAAADEVGAVDAGHVVTEEGHGDGGGVIIHSETEPSVVDLDFEARPSPTTPAPPARQQQQPSPLMFSRAVRGAVGVALAHRTSASRMAPMPSSTSLASSAEGFACNVTPALQTAPPTTATTAPPTATTDRSGVARAPRPTVASRLRREVRDARHLTRNSAFSLVAVDVDSEEPGAPTSHHAESARAAGEGATSTRPWRPFSGLRWGARQRAGTEGGGAAAATENGERKGAPRTMKSLLLLAHDEEREAAAMAAQKRRSLDGGLALGHRRNSNSLSNAARSVVPTPQLPTSAPATAVATPLASSSLPSPVTATVGPTGAAAGSRHSRRRSGLRYLNNGQEVRVDMGSGGNAVHFAAQGVSLNGVAEANRPLSLDGAQRHQQQALRAVLDAIKSPRVAPSPSGWTPQVHFSPDLADIAREGDSAAKGRPAWGVLPPTSPVFEGVEARRGGGEESGDAAAYALDAMQASRDRLGLLASQTMPGATLPHQYFSSEFSSKFQRRTTAVANRESAKLRYRHRYSASVPPTATIVPYNGTEAQTDGEGDARRTSRLLLLPGGRGAGRVVEVQDGEAGLGSAAPGSTTWDALGGRASSREAEVGEPYDRHGQPSSPHHVSAGQGRPMSIFVPTSAIEAHLLRVAGVHTVSDEVGARRKSGLLSQALSPLWPSSPSPHSLGGTAEAVTPSRNLFWAGFLGMPWLWLLGGWYVDERGNLPWAHASSRRDAASERVHFWEHEESMREARRKDLLVSRQRGTAGAGAGADGGAEADDSYGTAVEEATGADVDASVQAVKSPHVADEVTDSDRRPDNQDVDGGASRLLRKAKSNATLASRASSGSRLSMSHATRIPNTGGAARSLASFLSVHPEMDVARSPVRTVSTAWGRDVVEEALGGGDWRLDGEGKRDAQVHSPEGGWRRGETPSETRLSNSPALGSGTHEARPSRLVEPTAAAADAVATSVSSGGRRSWTRLERYVLLNRVAAVVGGTLVLAAFFSAIGAMAANF